MFTIIIVHFELRISVTIAIFCHYRHGHYWRAPLYHQTMCAPFASAQFHTVFILDIIYGASGCLSRWRMSPLVGQESPPVGSAT